MNAEVKALIGRRIKSLRKSRCLTQEKLAEIANLHPKYISSLECGRENPTLNLFIRISEALKVEISEIFTFEHERNSSEKIKGDIRRLVDNAGLEQLQTTLKMIRAILN